jgi:hypothetical protein
MSPSELKDLWTRIARPPGGRLNGRRLPGPGSSPIVWLAVDPEGAWHLLVEVPDETEAVTQRPTKGLTVVTEQMRIGEESPAKYVDLGCSEESLLDAFAAVAADVSRAVREVPGSPRQAVLDALGRWRRFWSIPDAGLTEEEALGLFGELWFVERWVGLPTGVRRWFGPAGARHDLQWPQASVEVKATRVSRDGPATHRIASLEQLEDPEVGRLYLFSLQARRDELAANTLPGLVGRLLGLLTGFPEDRALLLQRLGEAGYSPAHAERYEQKLRVVTEELYVVEGEFPRLTRQRFPSGLPTGVGDVSYSLDLTACAQWRVATRPTDLGLEFLRS